MVNQISELGIYILERSLRHFARYIFLYIRIKQGHRVICTNALLLPSPAIYIVVHVPEPADGRAGPRDDAQAASGPERGDGDGGALDGPPGPAPPAADAVVEGGLLLPGDGGRGDAEPAGPSPDHVAGAEVEQGGVGGPALDLDEGGGAGAREPVGDVLQADVGAVALNQQRHDAVHGHVGGQQPREQVPGRRDIAERRPGPRPGGPGRRGVHAAVALQVLVPPDQAQGDAGGDVGEHG